MLYFWPRLDIFHGGTIPQFPKPPHHGDPELEMYAQMLMQIQKRIEEIHRMVSEQAKLNQHMMALIYANHQILHRPYGPYVTVRY